MKANRLKFMNIMPKFVLIGREAKIKTITRGKPMKYIEKVSIISVVLFFLLTSLSWAEPRKAEVSPTDKADTFIMPSVVKLGEATLAHPNNQSKTIEALRKLPSTISPSGESSILLEGFEGNFPEDNGWALYSGDNGYTWDDDDYKPSSGNKSGWCAGGSYSGNPELDPQTDYYPDNMQGWMVYGPFDLSDATDAMVVFKYWLESENDYDYFGWYASTDGGNFYGYITSGNSSGWVERTFDLTDVYELGDLSGQPQVWIAFNFTSNGSVAYKGAFLDDIEIKKNVGELKPNLTPYQPTGWDYPIVPSSVTGTHTVDTLFANQPTYIDFAVINNGEVDIKNRFHFALYIDDDLIGQWYYDELNVNWHAYVEDFLHTISEGYHTLKIVADCDNEVDESDESDNEYAREFYWVPAGEPGIRIEPTSLNFEVSAESGEEKIEFISKFDSSGIQCFFESPPYRIVKGKKGIHSIDIKSFDQTTSLGDPKLPRKIFTIALPPDVDRESVTLNIIWCDKVVLKGIYDMEPVSPAATWVDGRLIVSWGKNKNIKNGKNLNTHNKDANYPEQVIEILGQTQMRKWNLLKVAYHPFLYNPVSGKLTWIKNIHIKICYKRLGISAIKPASLVDTVLDDVAQKIISNYEEAKNWYATEKEGILPSLIYDYVIITTNTIKNGSFKLNDFKVHKEGIGHSVIIITEDEYGSLAGQPPNGTAEKIRQWLKDNYQSMGIKYVLLIGDPAPETGDVPMKMCWPRNHESEYKESPTDYFYADLTGNWDLDGDLYFGEYNDDRGIGGVDFDAEVYVGRIPVYGSDYAILDNILQKLITYETEVGDLSWRKKALLPEAMSNYANEDGIAWGRTDGAELAIDMIGGYLYSAGFTSYTLYEKEGLNPCPYSCSAPLTQSNLIDEWKNSYGLVCWWAHGNETVAGRKYWAFDDGGGVPEGYEMSWPLFFSSGDCPSLDDSKPSLVYQASCLNGYPENSNNLGYALLKGGAAATVSASRVSWYSVGWSDPISSLGDNASIGYYYMEKIVKNNDLCGKAIFLTKANMAWGFEAESWMNLFDFNLYGDPTLTLLKPSGIEQSFTIFNDGAGNLEVTDITTQDGACWLSVAPPSPYPFSVAPEGYKNVTVSVDVSCITPGTYSDRLLLYSNDPDEGDPYPDGVYISLKYTSMKGDFDADRDVDGSGLATFADAYAAGDDLADLNNNGSVDVEDLAIFAANFGRVDYQ